MVKLFCGPWQDTLKDLEVDNVHHHIIADPPYSERTHKGQRSVDELTDSKIHYQPITEKEIREFAQYWTDKVFWIVLFCDHLGFELWYQAFDGLDRVVFAPVVWVKPNAAPRFSGDGPTSSCDYICVSRPRRETRCGSLPGHYIYNPDHLGFVGSKPINLMRSLIRDYTTKGDLVIDPFMGTGSTLIAADIEGRNAIGSELDPSTYARAKKRIEAGIQQSLF